MARLLKGLRKSCRALRTTQKVRKLSTMGLKRDKTFTLIIIQKPKIKIHKMFWTLNNRLPLWIVQSPPLKKIRWNGLLGGLPKKDKRVLGIDSYQVDSKIISPQVPCNLFSNFPRARRGSASVMTSWSSLRWVLMIFCRWLLNGYRNRQACRTCKL